MRLLVFVPVLAIVLVAAACSSGNDDDAGGQVESLAPLPTGVNTELLIGMLERLEAARDATYKVVYDFGSQPELGMMNATLTIVQKPPLLRTEVVDTTGGPALAFIGSSEGTVACRGEAGITSYECYETSAFMRTSPLAVTSDDLLAIADSLRKAQIYYSFAQSDQEIAGVKATCLTATASEELPDAIRERVGTQAELCASQDGVPLVIETNGGDADFSVRATEYTTDVSDAEFTAPGPVSAGVPNFQVPVAPDVVPEGS